MSTGWRTARCRKGRGAVGKLCEVVDRGSAGQADAGEAVSADHADLKMVRTVSASPDDS